MFKHGDIINFGDAIGLTVVDDFGHYYTLRAVNGVMDKVSKMAVNANGMLMSDYVKKNKGLVDKITSECHTYISRSINANLPLFVKADIKSLVIAYFTRDFTKAEKSDLFIKNRGMYYSALNWIRTSYTY